MPTENSTTPPPKSLEELFEQAIDLDGRRYMQAEFNIRERGDEAIVFLRSKQVSHPDSYEGFVAMTIADWMEGKIQDYEAAMESLNELEAIAKTQPIGKPHADIAEAYITRVADNRLASALALRVTKETLWPGWKVSAVLLYLKNHKVPETLPALKKYVSMSTDPARRSIAADTIADIERDLNTSSDDS